ncbi:MAG: hypothetical protein WA667_21840 [Candidatus Nitrosopolaris sp.]
MSFAFSQAVYELIAYVTVVFAQGIRLNRLAYEYRVLPSLLPSLLVGVLLMISYHIDATY